MKSDPDINLLQQEGLNVGYLAYNTQEPPFDNVKVRKALNMAINKEAIIDAVFQGAGKVAKNPFPPPLWSYNDAVKDVPYDPQASTNTLQAACVPYLKTAYLDSEKLRPYHHTDPRTPPRSTHP